MKEVIYGDRENKSDAKYPAPKKKVVKQGKYADKKAKNNSAEKPTFNSTMKF